MRATSAARSDKCPASVLPPKETPASVVAKRVIGKPIARTQLRMAKAGASGER